MEDGDDHFTWRLVKDGDVFREDRGCKESSKYHCTWRLVEDGDVF